MRVVHLPFTYYPDAVGGTEIYVMALVQGLRKLGVDGIIAASADARAVYSHDGTRVHRLAVSQAGLGLRELYGEGDPHVGAQFAELLDEEKLDVVHLHAFTSAISLRLVREAARRGIPVVFTYHTPTVSCQRETLMLWGKATCDGRLERRRCSQCTLHGLGMNRISSLTVGALPPRAGLFLGDRGRQGGLWTALRKSELVALRHNAVRSLWQEADGIIAVCAWVKGLLVRNGVPADKITISPHGLPQQGQGGWRRGATRAAGGSLRMAFLGRLHPTKGADLLVRALRNLPRAAIELDLYGISQGEADDRYRRLLVDMAAGDGRVRFLKPVPAERVARTLLRYDMLAVPSQGMETGPLVALEAFAAGIPVVGSDLGGIAEQVVHGVNGLLVQPFDRVDVWTATLKTLVNSPELVGRLTAGVKPPRGMDDVVRDMLDVYARVMASSCQVTS